MRLPDKERLNQGLFNQWVWDRLDDYSHRYEVFYGGGGSGKSYGAAQKVLLKALGNNRRVLVVRKTEKTLYDSVFRLFCQVLGGFGVRYDVQKTRLGILLPNQSEILFRWMEDRERIKSITGITDIVIEEATELDEEDFLQLDLRLRPPGEIKYPQIYLMFNPISRQNWCFHRWFEKGEPEGAVVVKSTYRDNQFLTAEYCSTLEALKETNPMYYKVYCLGEFGVMEQLVFPLFEKGEFCDWNLRGLPFWCGLDFGYAHDPSALTWGRLDLEKRELFVLGEFQKRGMTNPEIARVIRQLGLEKERIVADSAEGKSIEELKRLGIRRVIPARKGPDSVRFGIDFLRGCRIRVDVGCVHTIEELEHYCWEKDRVTGEYRNRPVDDYNHHIDSIRYGVQSVVRYGGIRW